MGVATTNPEFDTPPTPGADEHFIVFGYSQSAVVASLVKNDLVDVEPRRPTVWKGPSSS